MYTKGYDVSDDNIKLQELLEKHDLNVKQLSMWTGRAASTIYKYLSGELTIPSIIWRAIFSRTLDTDVAMLITGEVPCIIAPLVSAGTKAKLDAATLGEIIKVRQSQIDCEKYILKILADGKVDESDTAAIDKYKSTFGEMLKSQSQVFQAITGRFEAATSTQRR